MKLEVFLENYEFRAKGIFRALRHATLNYKSHVYVKSTLGIDLIKCSDHMSLG